MLEVIDWHMEQINNGVSYSGITNCHVPGLHSVVLNDTGHGMQRVYYADPTHALWRNDPASNEPWSLAVHGHRQNLTFIGLGGDAQSNVFAFSPHDKGPWHEMEYQSAITDGAGVMVPTGNRAERWYVEQNGLSRGCRIATPHWKQHSVWAPKDQPASWMVLEGPPVLSQSPNCWRNTLDDINWDDLYQPMTPADILNTLESIRSLL